MGNKGGFTARHERRLSRPSCKERNKAAISNLNATIQVSDNENVHYSRDTGVIPSVTSHRHGDSR